MRRSGLWLALAGGSALLHAGVVLSLPLPSARAAAPPRPPMDVAFLSPPPPPPSPPTTPTTPQPLAPSQAPSPPRAVAPAPSPAAAPAAAAAVLDAPSDATDLAVDFTLLQGDAARFSGGVTAANAPPGSSGGGPGTGSGGGRGTSPGAAGGQADLSAPARPASPSWSCSHLFPAEANAASIHSANVRVAVQVGADGGPRAVTILSDPGNGFASAARACARGQRYVPARDRAGRPTTALTAPFSVRFTR